MMKIEQIQGAVNVINNGFAKQFNRMDFLFTHRHRSHRTVINVLRSLPGMLVRLADVHAPDIEFEATWVGDQKARTKSAVTQGGWQEAASSMSQYQQSYFAHTFAAIRSVREVSVFDYGFEIRSADNVDLMVVKSAALQNPSVAYLQSIVGRQFKGLQFADGVDDEVKAMWSHEGDVFMDRIKKQMTQERGSDMPFVGQSTRKLLLDVEDV